MTASLYERLGGAERIQQLVALVVDKHYQNPLIKTRFEIVKDRATVERHVVEFFCAGSGGPQAYTGRDMVSTHRGMNLNEQELIAAMDDIVSAMTELGHGQTEKNDVIAILYSLKGEVLHQ